jgi:phage terminase large subunit-like protein
MLVRSKSDEEKLRLGGVYDEDRGGNRVIRFIESNLVLESGKPFVLLPWMKDFIHSVYSWFRPDGLRFTKIGLLTCARKNAKSALTYGLTAYHLLADGMMSPRCASVAVNKEQAAQIYDWLRFAVESNVKLASALHCVNHKKQILYPKKNGHYRSLSSDVGGKFGHGFGFVVHDELAFHKKDDLYNALKNSGDAIPNSLQVITSTAGFNKNAQFFKLVQYGKKVLAGEVVDPTFQPWVFETPDAADLDDEANWRLANPSLGVTHGIEDFRAQWNRDKQEATSRHTFCILKFNQYKDAENVWIPVEAWDACKAILPPLDGRAVVLGVDVGATRDLTAVSLVAPLDDKTVAVKSWGFGHSYLHRDGKGYVKPETSRRENKKDNLIALLMALSQALQVDVSPPKPSVY